MADHSVNRPANPSEPAVVPAVGSESSVPNRPDVPGGTFQPARITGAIGPTTRDPVPSWSAPVWRPEPERENKG